MHVTSTTTGTQMNRTTKTMLQADALVGQASHLHHHVSAVGNEVVAVVGRGGTVPNSMSDTTLSLLLLLLSLLCSLVEATVLTVDVDRLQQRHWW
jgi:hypothetical protein